MEERNRHLDDEELIGFVWGELESSEADRVQSHLESCPKCRERLELLRRVRRGLRLLSEEEVPAAETVWPAVERRLRRARRRILLVWPAAAALLLAVWFAFRPSSEEVAQAPEPEAEFAVLHAEIGGRPASVFVFNPSDSVVTVWLQ